MGGAVAEGDFLGAEDFGDGFGPPGSCFNGGVVRYDDGGAVVDSCEAGNSTPAAGACPSY